MGAPAVQCATDATGSAILLASVLREMAVATIIAEAVVAVVAIDGTETMVAGPNVTNATGSVILLVSVAKRRIVAINVMVQATSQGTAIKKRIPATTVIRLVTW